MCVLSAVGATLHAQSVINNVVSVVTGNLVIPKEFVGWSFEDVGDGGEGEGAKGGSPDGGRDRCLKVEAEGAKVGKPDRQPNIPIYIYDL